ncbi:hypothetical protein SK128_004310 [Halocaridina rubra]|uniref:BHLH domain-containing protein n=1 Tax=Halocaridina rubra TaxID=373956 RepID=A0AAN8WJ25_HALRR
MITFFTVIRKPLMERKRRERINNSLNDLAILLTEANMVKTEGSKTNKLEKADILELTVKHLQKLKEEKHRGGSSPSTSREGCCDDEASNSIDLSDASSSSREKEAESVSKCDNFYKNDNLKVIPSGGENADNESSHTCAVPLKESDRLNVEGEVNFLENSDGTENKDITELCLYSPDLKGNDENYVMGFRKCISAIDNAMKSQENPPQENLRPKLLKHLQSFLKSLDINLKSPSSFVQEKSALKAVPSPSIESQPSSSKGVDVSSTTSENEIPSLTLVPTRLPGGSLAFVVRGGAEATMLLQSAESLLQKDQANNENTDGTADNTGANTLTQFETRCLVAKENDIKVEGAEQLLATTTNVTTSARTMSASKTLTSLRPGTESLENTNRPTPPLSSEHSVNPTQQHNSSPPEEHIPSKQTNMKKCTQSPTKSHILAPFPSPAVTPTTSGGRLISVKTVRIPSISCISQKNSTPADGQLKKFPSTPISTPIIYELNTSKSIPSTPVTKTLYSESNIFTKSMNNFGKADFPLTPTTPGSSSYSTNYQVLPSASHALYSSHGIHQPTNMPSVSSHTIYSSPKPLTPPPTPKQTGESKIPMGGSSAAHFLPASPSLLPSSHVYNHPSKHLPHSGRYSESLPNIEGKDYNSAKSGNNDGEERRQEGEPNNLIEGHRRDNIDNELPFDLSLRRMWRPW